MIELFGYRIYPLFWILIITVPLFLFLFFKTLFSIKRKKREKGYRRITAWQKENLPKVISRAIKEQENKEEIEVLKEVRIFIGENKYWSSDKLYRIHPKAITILNFSLYSIFLQLYFAEQRVDESTYILHSMDVINGGLDHVSRRFEWIGDEVQMQGMFAGMDVSEDRMSGIWLDSIQAAMDRVDLDIMKIPRDVPAFEELYEFVGDDFQEAANDILGSDDMFNLENKTYPIIVACMVDKVNQYIAKSKDREGLHFVHLYYIRSLICAIERENYRDLLDFFKRG